MFGRNKNLSSQEFEELNKKIVSIVGDLDTAKTELANVKTSLNSLRGLVNRRISLEKEEEDTEKDKKKGILAV